MRRGLGVYVLEDRGDPFLDVRPSLLGVRKGPVASIPVSAVAPTESRQKGLSIAFAAAISALLFGLVLRRHLVDDAYITLSYARNFAEHLHWGVIPDETANTATSPLDVLVLAALVKIVGDAVWAAGVLYVLSVTITFLAVHRLIGPAEGAASGALWALTITGLIELNPIMLSSAGLESTLFVAILAWLAVAAQAKSAIWFGILAGALILTRPDGALFVATLSVALALSIRRWAVACLVAAVIVAAWVIPSWFVLGSAVPDTLIMKRDERPWGGHYFGTGLLLLGKHYPLAVITSVAIPAVSLLVLVAARIMRSSENASAEANGWALRLLIIGGFVHYGGYTLLRPPPYHWYYSLSFSAVTLGAQVLLVRRYGAALPLRFLVGALLIVSVVVLAMNSHTQFAPISTNWQSSAQAEQMAKNVAEIIGRDRVGLDGEIGAVAYYCRCEIIDDISNMSNLNGRIGHHLAMSTGLSHPLLSLNYRHRDLTGPLLPEQYFLAATVDPSGHPWSWPATSPWRGINYYVLTGPFKR